MPENDNPDHHGQETEPEPLSPLIKAYIDHQIHTSTKEQGVPHKKKWKNAWRSASPITKGSFMMTAAIAVATIAYAILAYFQLGKMSGQLRTEQNSTYITCLNSQLSRQALMDARASSLDTRRVADASILQAIASAQSSRALVERTNVGRENMTISSGIPIVVPFGIKNSGKTAAINVRVLVRFACITRASDPDFSYPPDGLTMPWILPVMNPGRDTTDSELEKHITVPLFKKGGSLWYLSPEEVHDYVSEKRDFILYGKITYRDDFGTQTRQFCEVFSHQQAGLMSPAGHQKCSEYNRQDRNPLFAELSTDHFGTANS